MKLKRRTANKKIDKTENEINEIEEMKLAANKKIDKTENEINEMEEQQTTNWKIEWNGTENQATTLAN